MATQTKNVAAPPKPPTPTPTPTPTPGDRDKALAAAVEKVASKAHKADLAVAEKAAKDTEKEVKVRDFSTDKPNRDIGEYRMPKDGKFWLGSGAKGVTQRDSGINRFAILIARPGGCTEAEGRHVNPRGYEYSGGFAGYVASNIGMTVVVKDGRYQVGSRKGSTVEVDETLRSNFFNALGGEKYLEQTVNFIRGNAKYDYSGFTLSEPPKRALAPAS